MVKSSRNEIRSFRDARRHFLCIDTPDNSAIGFQLGIKRQNY
jgi:hypothetical protein